MTVLFRPRSLILASVIALCTAGALHADAVSEAIAARVTTLSSNSEIDGASVAATDVLPAVYAERDNAPIWFATPAGKALLGHLNAGIMQGFRPADFHLPMLLNLQQKAETGTPSDIAAFDILASDAVARLIHHLLYGKVDPETLHSDWTFNRLGDITDPATVLALAAEDDGLSIILNDIAPSNHQYRDLTKALATYRGLDVTGGWPHVPEGNSLKPGMSDPRVILLRARLNAEIPGTLSATTTPELYDAPLEAAVIAFQTRHGLEGDGVVGPRSYRALNRTPAERVDQIRISLERMRWFGRELEDDFVLVNIAAPHTYFIKDGAMVWSTRSITGSAYRKTPVFRDEIEYIDVNPTWTVPYSIFRNDKLAKIRSDPGYLDRNNYIVRRTSDGATVPASSVNWHASNPGVTLVQQPGPDNALGRIKFMFPNAHAVYLHDTNDKSLFDRTERNLSSGCVRLEDPYGFAHLLMADDPSWSEARLQSILDSKKTTRIPLPKPVPVMLTYWTAWVANGQVQFREDIYERDGPILQALNAKITAQ